MNRPFLSIKQTKYLFLVIFFFQALSINIIYAQNTESNLRQQLEIKKDTSLVKAYLDLAKYYYQTTGKGDSLIFYSNKALKLSRDLNSEKQALEALKYSGVGYLINKEFDRAETNFKSSLSIAIKNNDLKNQANLHNKLGTLYQNKGKQILAINNLIKASKYSEKIKDYKNIAQAYYGISHIYSTQKQFDKELEYINKAINVIENNKINDPLMENIIFGFASQEYLELYKNQKNTNYLDNVFKYAKKALEISKKNNFKSREISSYNVLSAYYSAKKDFINSEFYAKKVLKNRHLVNEEIIINAFFNLANRYKARQQKSMVYAYIDTLNALNIKSRPYYGASISNFTYEKYKFYNDTDLALKALEEKLIFDKELYNKEKNKSINELETKYKSELKDKEIVKKQSQINKLLALIIALALIATIILFVIKTIQLRKVKSINTSLEKAVEKQLKLEKELTDVRDNLAQDFHDDLGNKLARLSFISKMIASDSSLKNQKVKNKINQITKDANSLYNGTRDFIFSLKSNSNCLEEVVTYLSDFGEDYFSKTEVKFVLIKKISKKKLPHYWSKQLVYIFKEALTNTLKHSKCSQVTLQFEFKNNELRIRCIDNGIGINKADLNSKNGLLNMKKRASKIGGELTIENNKSGTIIQFKGKTT